MIKCDISKLKLIRKYGVQYNVKKLDFNSDIYLHYIERHVIYFCVYVKIQPYINHYTYIFYHFWIFTLGTFYLSQIDQLHGSMINNWKIIGKMNSVSVLLVFVQVIIIFWPLLQLFINYFYKCALYKYLKLEFIGFLLKNFRFD